MIEALRQVAADHGATPSQVALHWLVSFHGDAVVALHGGGNGDFNPTGLSVQVSDVESACAEIETGGGLIRKAPGNRPGEPIKLPELADPEGNGFMMSEYVD